MNDFIQNNISKISTKRLLSIFKIIRKKHYKNLATDEDQFWNYNPHCYEEDYNFLKEELNKREHAE